MKKDWSHLEQFRNRSGSHPSCTGDTFGCFYIPYGPQTTFCIIACDGEQTDWEHVSVHAIDPRNNKVRTPSWDGMCFVKNQFWGEDETVIQFHPKKSDYVNQHPNTLHLWKHTKGEQPTPPVILV
jgi:hypothetical protein